MKTLNQSSLAFNDPYVPQHDQAIVERLKDLHREAGLGDTIDVADDEFGEVLGEFGIDPGVTHDKR